MLHIAFATSLLSAATLALTAGAILLLVFASLHDIAVRTIPDGICVALACIGLFLRLADGHLAGALLAAVIVFAVTMMFCLRGWMGGGDVKLLSASVLLLPPARVADCIFFVGLAGALLALFYVMLRRLVPRPGPLPTSLLARICRTELFRIRRGGPLPYGVGIAAGAILTLLTSKA
jgi:prepilin peptidase CpaA